MDRILNILTIIFQLALTFILTVSIYLVFAFFDSDFGIDGLVGLLIFQPIIGVVLSTLTVILCLIVGLPIRLNKRIKSWWTNRFYISIIGTSCGLAFLFISTLPQLTETVIIQVDGHETLKQIPNSFLAYTGWFLTAFMTLHIFPPDSLKIRIKKIFGTASSLIIAFSILLTFSKCSPAPSEKKPILLADREAPIGWVYLRIYEDSTFEFSDTKYQGKVFIKKDTLLFEYKNLIPKVGTTAILKDNWVVYTNGLRERLEIKLNKLKK